MIFNEINFYVLLHRYMIKQSNSSEIYTIVFFKNTDNKMYLISSQISPTIHSKESYPTL